MSYIKNFFIKNSTKSNDLTNGNIRKQLFYFCIPFLLSNLMQILYNVTDTLIISYALGEGGVSASNNGGQIINVIINVVNGLVLGGTVLIGQQKGSNDSSETSKTIGTFLSVMLIIGFLITIIFSLFSKYILIALNTPSLVLDDATAFLRIYSFAIIFIFCFNSISAIFRGIGNSFYAFFIRF